MGDQKKWIRRLSMLLVLCMVVTSLTAAGAPLSVKAAGEEAFRPGRVLIISGENPEGTELGQKVSLVASEFIAKGAASRLAVVYGSAADAKEDDLIISLDENLAEQEYAVTAGDGQVSVAAGSPTAVMYGMRGVLKTLLLGNEVTDTSENPDVAMRILHLDCGRKYFSKEWIIALVKELSWLGMNQLELDFSNGSGFRFALDDMMLDADGDGVEETDISMLPGGTTDPEGYLTEAEMDEIIATADAYGVEIVPNLDTPGHLGWILGQEEFSQYNSDVGLDVTNPEATAFVGAIVKKFAAYFLEKGCTTFHLGGDEYIHSSPSWMGNVDTSVYYDEVADYLDNLAGDLKEMGYQKTRLFNDSLYYNGFTSHEWKNIDEASYWSSGMWGFYFTQPSELAEEKGIRLINSNQSYYNVLNNSDNWKLPVGDAETKKSPAGIYSQWKNDVFETLWSDPDNLVTADKQYIDGSTYFMWCDRADAGTQQEVAVSLYPRLRSAAAKMADDTLSGTYEEFAKTFTDSVGGFTREGEIQNISLAEFDEPVRVYGDDEAGEKLIAMIEELDASAYTAESWAAVESAVAAAKEAAADPNATQADKDAALATLIQAYGALEYAVEKLHLEVAIQAAEDLLVLSDNYISGTEELRAVTEAGKAVLEDPNATQEEVDLAAYAILDAMAVLVEKTDIASLESLVNAAKQLLDGNYTESSLNNLADAIAKAEAVIADTGRNEDAIASAYTELINAIVNLKMKGNKAALHAMIVRAEGVLENKGVYVASTLQGLESVLAEAQEVYEDESAKQTVIDDAIVKLTLKLADLRLLGDVNGDGSVTTSDSAALLRYSAELETLDAEAKESADVNGDGIADTSDAALILQYAAEKITAF